MSSIAPSSSFHFAIDDLDLDDAELWAVIDSAAASRSRKPLLALKNPNPFALRNPSDHLVSESGIRVQEDGEVVQEEHWPHRRPPKMARFSSSPSSDDRRLVILRNPPRTPAAASLPFSSPVSGKISAKESSPVIESPMSDHWLSEERESVRSHSLEGRFPSVSLFKQYQNAAMAILEKTDYTMIQGSPYIKKSGWRKISFFFNLSFEIKDKSIECDENRNVQRAEFVIRAYMQGGRFSDGWGSCDRREKRFMKPNHDIPSTAETRAKNKACQDLLGIGEYRSGMK